MCLHGVKGSLSPNKRVYMELSGLYHPANVSRGSWGISVTKKRVLRELTSLSDLANVFSGSWGVSFTQWWLIHCIRLGSAAESFAATNCFSWFADIDSFSNAWSCSGLVSSLGNRYAVLVLLSWNYAWSWLSCIVEVKSMYICMFSFLGFVRSFAVFSTPFLTFIFWISSQNIIHFREHLKRQVLMRITNLLIKSLSLLGLFWGTRSAKA